MRIEVDRDLCCGSGNCVMTLPEVFDQDNREGLVVVLKENPPAGTEELVRRAASICPAGAIALRET